MNNEEKYENIIHITGRIPRVLLTPRVTRRFSSVVRTLIALLLRHHVSTCREANISADYDVDIWRGAHDRGCPLNNERTNGQSISYAIFATFKGTFGSSIAVC